MTASQLYSSNVTDPDAEEPTTEFVKKNLALYQQAYSEARRNLRSSILTQQRTYNKKGHSYVPGELVLLFHPTLKKGESAKFHQFW